MRHEARQVPSWLIFDVRQIVATESPFFVPGITHVGSHTTPGSVLVQHSYKFEATADDKTVVRLLREVTEKRDLTFFDADHPRLSDPGAYITLVRSGRQLLAMRGNHGWSSSWIAISDEEAARYLTMCIPFNGPSADESVTTFEPIDPLKRAGVDRSLKSDFRAFLDARLKKKA